jgi:caffeoyl-CoA O-methyltransferase
MKYLSLNDQLYRYLCECRSDANDPILDASAKGNRGPGRRQPDANQPRAGQFHDLACRGNWARSAIEVGTFTGYSSLCIARGLAEGGRLICIDESKEWTAIARRYWAQAGVQNKNRASARSGDSRAAFFADGFGL